MSLGTTYSPQSLREGLQVTNFDHCLHIVMAIGSLQTFSGDFLVWGEVEGRVTREDLSMDEFVMGEENFNEGGAGLSSII